MLAQRMESKITSDVSITPLDVQKFFNRIPKDSLPIFPEEIHLSQIIVYPKVDQQERKRLHDKLNDFKKRIQNGEDFSFLASLYSDDGSASQGGDLGFVKKGNLFQSLSRQPFVYKKENFLILLKQNLVFILFRWSSDVVSNLTFATFF